MPHHTRSRTEVLLGAGCALVGGALVAVQSDINGELGSRLSDGFCAALISFSVGLVVLTVMASTTRHGRQGFRHLMQVIGSREHPWWFYSGGAFGGFLVLSQGLAAAELGVALFTVGIVAGQLVNGTVIDRRGLGPLAAVPPTATRMLGAGLAVVAVVIAVAGGISDVSSWWLLAMPILAGAGAAFQQAINGHVRHVTDSVLTATLWNFVVGTGLLAAVFCIDLIVQGPPNALPHQPWLYIGGLVGVGFIWLNAALVRHLGVLLLSMCAIAGQVIGSMVIDLVTQHPVGTWTYVGSALTVVAVGVAALPTRRPSQPAQ